MSDKIPSKAINILQYVAQWPEQPFLYEDVTSKFPGYDVERYLKLLSANDYIQSGFPFKDPYGGENDFSMEITEKGLNFLETLNDSPLKGSIPAVFKFLGNWLFDHCSPASFLALFRRFFD